MLRCLSAADKQLLATARRLNGSGGALARAIDAGRFTGAKQQDADGARPGRWARPAYASGRRQGARARCARPPKALGGLVAPMPTERVRRPSRSWSMPVKGTKLSAGRDRGAYRARCALRAYRFDKYKTKDKPEQKPALEQLTIVLAGPGRRAEGLCRARADHRRGVLHPRPGERAGQRALSRRRSPSARKASSPRSASRSRSWARPQMKKLGMGVAARRRPGQRARIAAPGHAAG